MAARQEVWRRSRSARGAGGGKWAPTTGGVARRRRYGGEWRLAVPVARTMEGIQGGGGGVDATARAKHWVVTAHAKHRGGRGGEFSDVLSAQCVGGACVAVGLPGRARDKGERIGEEKEKSNRSVDLCGGTAVNLI